MTLHLPHMLSTSVLQRAPIAPRPAWSELIFKDGPAAAAPDDGGLEPAARRTRIWEFGVNLHCSIIGTCLSTAELRHVLAKLTTGEAGNATDHELHSLGVMIAGRREGGARFLQKALDRRHRVAITRYARAKDAAALLALWEESLKQGDIPGAYWAVLTHPAAEDDIIKRAFGDVHMLSHLVGAANRADVRRLRQLEEENTALLAKIERQQRQLRDGFIARDQTIRQLNEMIVGQANDRTEASGAPRRRPTDVETVDHVVTELDRRLIRETARADRMERRFNEASAMLQGEAQTSQAIKRELEATRRELEVIEAHLGALVQPARPAVDTALNLSGCTILYVGGRVHQIPRLKALVERAGGDFLHHDGGIEHSSGLLPSLVSRADHVTFPVDCVSHDAVATIKKLCRQAGRPYQPLRTASLACLLSALPTISRT